MQIVAVTDPLTLGFRRQTMIAVKCDGDLEEVADKLADIDEIDYVVITAGSFDLLLEVVCEDDDHLLEILSRVRARAVGDQHRDVRVPEVAQADLFVGNQMTKLSPNPTPNCSRRPGGTSGCTSPGCPPTPTVTSR